MKKWPFILSPLFCLFNSCEEEKSKHWTEITLTASNYVTGESISDINCGVLTIDDGFLFNDKTVILDEQSMKDGIYHFGFKANKNQTYWAEASFDLLKYHIVNFSNYVSINNGTSNYASFELVPYGSLKLDIQNLACFDTNDKLIFKRVNLLVPNDNTDWSTERMGCYSYQSSHFFEVPIGSHEYIWQVTKNGITNTYSQVVEVNEGDYKTVCIYY